MNVPAELTGLFFATPAPEPVIAAKPPPTDPAADRITYASFPESLRTAMKIAAQRNGWCRETWAMQTQMLNTSMLAGCYSADELAAAYRNQPPVLAMKEAA